MPETLSPINHLTNDKSFQVVSLQAGGVAYDSEMGSLSSVLQGIRNQYQSSATPINRNNGSAIMTPIPIPEKTEGVMISITEETERTERTEETGTRNDIVEWILSFINNQNHAFRQINIFKIATGVIFAVYSCFRRQQDNPVDGTIISNHSNKKNAVSSITGNVNQYSNGK